MIETITPIPPSFEDLRIATLKRPLVPFIGAGVSQLGGCPGWDDFADGALRFFVAQRKLSHAEYDQIKDLSSRIKLSLALELEESCELKIDFADLLRPSTEEEKANGTRIYEKLDCLASTFVTTNYDDWLDKARNVFYKYEDLSMKNFDAKNAVFHIHGSVRDPSSMVRTTDEYLLRYASHEIVWGADGENPFLTFLRKLFELKTVLFIGYSLSELEVLEYVLQKSVDPHEARPIELRHFMLQGFFSHQVPLANNLARYFARFGVRLIPFCRDERDWSQLGEVVDALARELPAGAPLALPKLREMEGLLE
ncbi:MAG: SIR2 family protein [Bryobacterales bacterium]|nr:SIR2 family protein [Bryobacterales bacterium]